MDEKMLGRVPSKLASYIDAARMSPKALGVWVERFVQAHTGTTGYDWDERWKGQRVREMLDYLDSALRQAQSTDVGGEG